MIRHRIIQLRGVAAKRAAACAIARLVVLAAEMPEELLVMQFDSLDISARESARVLSTLSGISNPVAMWCRGTLNGPASVLVAHGNPGLRTAAPDARFVFHGFAGGGEEAPDESVQGLLVQRLSAAIGKPEAEVRGWFESGAEFTAQEALARGLIDSISSERTLSRR